MVRFGRAATFVAPVRVMIDCTLVTCEMVPTLDPDDRLILDELRGRGLTVRTAIWSDPHIDWSGSKLTILRSTWDYHRRYREFAEWIDRVSEVTALRNDARLLHWNVHKSYLRDLELRGVPVVPTAWVRRGERCSLAVLRTTNGWRDCVIKPARGVATHGVLHVRCDRASSEAGQAHLDDLARDDDVLVQPYFEEVVTYGERALIFFDGHFSHAVMKKPFDTVLAVGDARAAAVQPTPDEIEVAARALAAVPGPSLYARIDLLRDARGDPHVSELELIEPALYFGASRGGLRLFADSIEHALDVTYLLNWRPLCVRTASH